MKKNQPLNLLPIAQDYFNTIFSDISGMKSLLLDKQTSGIISVIYTQSKLYKNDIYLIQKIDDQSEKLTHLKAIYFVRPTIQNVELIKKQMVDPRFQQYHLYFTNELNNKYIDQLAASDASDKIKNIQEVYLDYFAFGRNIFSLNIPSTISLSKRAQLWGQPEKNVINRVSQGLISLVMSLRLLPQVRYLNGSQSCQKIAARLSKKLQSQLLEKKSDYKKDQNAIIIITQRKQDVITPLITPWTYEAMLHEFIGIFNNKVDIVNKQKAFLNQGLNQPKSIKQKQQRQFVLSEISDDFFKKNVYKGFAQLATNIKQFISEVSSKRNKTVKLESLEDMHSALDKIPQLNALSATLQKHVTLSCQISDQIQKGVLFEVSRVQQDLVCQDSRSNNIEGVWKILKNQKIEYYLKFKLILLFSIKYPNDKELKQFLAYLANLNPDRTMLPLINLISQYQSNKKSDLFHISNIKKKATSFFNRVMKDVPNVYCQHKPYFFEEVIPDFVADKISQQNYRIGFEGTGTINKKPIIILFFVGGVTYTEAKEADQYDNAKVIVGGTFVHNSKTFVGEVIQLQSLLEAE